MTEIKLPLATIVTLVLMLLCLGGGYWWGDSSADQQWKLKWTARDGEDAKKEKADAEATAKRNAEERTKEQDWQTAMNRIQADAEQDLARQRAATANARAAADRLQQGVQQAINQLAASTVGTGAGVAVSGKAGASAGALLAELFRGIDDLAGQYAAEADRARAAGLTCERAYDALRVKGE